MSLKKNNNMTKENYQIAKSLREKISHFEVKLTQIRLMKEREDDEDFNTLRQLAFDGCDFVRSTLEKEFEKL